MKKITGQRSLKILTQDKDFLSLLNKTTPQLLKELPQIDLKNSINSKGSTVLHAACKFSNLEIIQNLVEIKKLNLNVKNTDGKTPLHSAWEKPIIDNKIIEYLFEKIDISILDREFIKEIKQKLPSLQGKKALVLAEEFTNLFTGKNNEIIKKIENLDLKSSVTDSGVNLLHAACKFSNLQIIMHLVEVKNFDINAKNNHDKNPLHLAYENKNITSEMTEYLFEKIDVSILDKKFIKQIKQKFPSLQGKKILLLDEEFTNFFKGEDNEIIKKIENLDLKSSVTDSGVNLLHAACKFSNLQIIMHLVEVKNFDINAKNNHDKNPLHLAYENKNITSEMTEYLFEKIDVSILDKKFIKQIKQKFPSLQGKKILLLDEEFTNFFKGEDNEIIKRIDEVDLKNSVTKEGDNLLHVALINHGTKEVINHLIGKNTFNIHTKNSKGDSPLLLACKKDNPDVELIKCLIEAGANPNIKDKYEKAPLHSVCQKVKIDFELVRCLGDNGADVNGKDTVGNTPLLLVCKKDNPDVEVIKYLIKKGANPNIKDKYEKAALHYVCEKNTIDFDLVKCLVDNKANVNIKDKYEKAALHYVCEKDPIDFDLVKCLVDNKANVNEKDESGNTPLLLVGEQTKIDFKLLKYLVDNNADVNHDKENLILRNIYYSETAATKFGKSATKELMECVFNKVDLSLYNMKFIQECKEKFPSLKGQRCLVLKEEYDTFLKQSKSQMLEQIKSLDVNYGLRNLLNWYLEHNICLERDTTHAYDIDIIKALIDKKSDMNSLTSYYDKSYTTKRYSYSSLQYVCQSIRMDDEMKLEIIKYMIKNKADLNITSGRNETALYFAAQHFVNLDIIKCLIEHNARTDHQVVVSTSYKFERQQEHARFLYEYNIYERASDLINWTQKISKYSANSVKYLIKEKVFRDSQKVLNLLNTKELSKEYLLEKILEVRNKSQEAVFTFLLVVNKISKVVKESFPEIPIKKIILEFTNMTNLAFERIKIKNDDNKVQDNNDLEVKEEKLFHLLESVIGTNFFTNSPDHNINEEFCQAYTDYNPDWDWIND
jgi:ankyrin repeat protein